MDDPNSEMNGGNLIMLEPVLEEAGFNITWKRPKALSEIDLIWTRILHTRDVHKGYFNRIEAHQRVNHIKSISYFSSKLALLMAVPHLLPKSFNLPEEFSEWKKVAVSNPNWKWVTKSKGHRNVNFLNDPLSVTSLASLQNMKINVQDTLVQRFIENPLLIDNYKFEIGFYVLATSTLPTRMYFHQNRIFNRFCMFPYEPFNPANRRSYVTDVQYKTADQIPSLKKYLDAKVSLFDGLIHYLKKNGYDSDGFENNVIEIVTETMYKLKPLWFQKSNVAIKTTDDETINEDGSSRNFAIFRFDFNIEDLGDGSLHPWLLEITFSPNLNTGLHTKGLANILYDVLSTTGALKYGKPWQDEEKGNESGEFNDEDLPRLGCDEICTKEEIEREDYCRICSMKTFPKHAIGMIRQTISEQLGKRQFKRVIPPAPSRDQSWKEYMAHLDKLSGKTQSPKDKILATWLYLACQKQKLWCY